MNRLRRARLQEVADIISEMIGILDDIKRRSYGINRGSYELK